MDWQHGYFVDNGYTYGFHDETSPARLAWAATLQGYRANLDQFRYIDLGCGQGLNLILLAALHPTAEFVGVDFMPEHIAHGRQLAQQAGLSNIKFIEGDFIELATDPSGLGEFDYAIAHGITTWIAPEVRKAMFALAQVVLKPGGLMYNSYNTHPGWLHTAPFQHMVLQYQKRMAGQQALEASKELFAKLFDGNSALTNNLTTLHGRIKSMDKQDSDYLVQEYNNKSWQPVYSNQMLEIAKRHKLKFIGSATMSEVFEDLYPAPLIDLIKQESDPITREIVRDLAIVQSFRRDIYAKGAIKHWSAQRHQVITQQRFIARVEQALPPDAQQFTWLAGTINLTGSREVFKKIIETFSTQGSSIIEAMAALNVNDLPTFLRQVSLLLQGGWLALEGSADQTNAKKLNRTMANAVLEGAPYQYLCAPRLQSTITINYIQFLLIASVEEGDTPTTLGQKLIQRMKALNKRFAHDGKAIEDPKQILSKATIQAELFLKDTIRRYKSLGAI